MMTPEILAKTTDYFVINKPAGIATEPPSSTTTLRDWLIEQTLIKAGEWNEESRYGIVHRLDTDTSGVIIWAKNLEAQSQLRHLWQGRQVKKTYLALVSGKTEKEGVIELPLERDNQQDRQRVALLPSEKSRPALTRYRTLTQGKIGEWPISLVEVQPITGRNHQIRVHLKAIGHPIIADALYGEKTSTEIARVLGLNRQFLHAWSIELPTGERYQAKLPVDLQIALEHVHMENPLT